MAFFGFLMACLGGLIVNRAARSDVTMAWLTFYLALLFGRSYWLGEPMTIPVHRLQSGGLLLSQLFPDLGSEDDAGFARGPDHFCGARGVRRLVGAVPDLPNEWRALVAGGVRITCSGARLSLPRKALLVARSAPGFRLCGHGRHAARYYPSVPQPMMAAHVLSP